MKPEQLHPAGTHVPEAWRLWGNPILLACARQRLRLRSAIIWGGATLVIVAGSVAFASLLSGVHLQGRYRRLVPTAYALAGVAGAFLIAVAWGFRAGEAWRLFGVVAVLLSAATLAAPIAAHLRPAQEGPPPIRHCPYCARPLAEAGGRVTSCGSCGRRFQVIGR